MSRQLPPQPNLDVLKKQARQLLNDHKDGQSEAVARVQAVIADLPAAATDSFGLRHAQQVLAGEYGFSSWQALLDLMAGLEQTWRPLAELRTTRIESQVDPFALGMPMYHTCLQLAFEMTTSSNAKELPGIVRLCYPAPAITDVLDGVEVLASAE